LLTFSTTDRLENVHPLQGGIFRLKHPSERRAGLSRENPWFFWPRFTWEILVKHVILARTIGRLLVWQTAIAYNPGARHYMDQALTRVTSGKSQLLPFQTCIPARLKHLGEPSSPAPQELDSYWFSIL